MVSRLGLHALAAAVFSAATLPAQIDDGTRLLSRDIFRELIEINTTDSSGSTTLAAEAMRKRLLDAGFEPADLQVLGPNDRKGNLLARLHGSGAHKPILIVGHLDVVETRREDWTINPFEFIEKDGYFYGRGTQDMKDNDAILVTTFIRFKREGYRPDRDRNGSWIGCRASGRAMSTGRGAHWARCGKYRSRRRGSRASFAGWESRRFMTGYASRRCSTDGNRSLSRCSMKPTSDIGEGDRRRTPCAKFGKRAWAVGSGSWTQT